MTQREQLLYLIREYNKCNYKTITFCDEFTRIICLEQDNSLSKEETKLFLESNEVFARYSPFKEDVDSGFLFGEEEIKKEFNKLVTILKNKFSMDV